MAITLKDVRKGSIVMVAGRYGKDPAVRARVVGTYEGVALGEVLGQPIIDYVTLSDNEGYWAYLNQIEKVITY